MQIKNRRSRSLYAQARQFARYELHYNVTKESLMQYLKKVDYKVIFYTKDKPHDMIKGYDLVDLSQSVKGFTFCENTDKFVFLRSDVAEDRGLYTLLHEVGHIALDHLGENHIPKHKRLEEMEAETFAYAVLNCRDNRYKYAFIASVACGIVLFSASVISQVMGLL